MTAGALVNANGSVWRGTRNSNATLPTRSRVTGREVDEYGRELTVTGADRAAVARCVRTYGEARRFLETFNPSLQGRTMESEERTFAGRLRSCVWCARLTGCPRRGLGCRFS